MKIRKCPNCEWILSPSAHKCPKCGADTPLPKYTSSRPPPKPAEESSSPNESEETPEE